MTRTSASRPTAAAAARPATIPTTQGNPATVINRTASVAGNTPRSPWAKFTTRFERHTSARPIAPNEPSNPMMSPENDAPIGMGKKTSCTTRMPSTGAKSCAFDRTASAVLPDTVKPHHPGATSRMRTGP
jgi:hypothetical protein